MTSTRENSTPKLPVWKVLAGAFRLPWGQRKPLARVIAMPLLFVTAVGLAGELDPVALSESLQLFWVFCYVVPTAWLAVNVHRFLLSDLTGARAKPVSRNWKRVALYASALLAFWMSFFVAVPILEPVDGALAAINTADSTADLEQVMTTLLRAMVLGSIVSIAVALIAGRLCLVLPAIAVDGDVRAAIHAARGNTVRLTVVLSLLSVALPLPAELLLGVDASFMEAGLLAVLGSVFVILEAAALSLSYRELTSPAPPPTDPPA